MHDESTSGPPGSGDAPRPRGIPDAAVTMSLQLVQRAQGNDQQALNRLFQHYYERVRSIIRMRMGKRMRGYMESGDILQETFVAALRGFDRFEVQDEKSFIHWLAKIAENQIRAAAEYHHAKKRDRRRDHALEGVRSSLSSGELTLDPMALGPDVITVLGAREDLEDLLACTEELTDEQREVLSLRLLEFGDNRWDEIGAALGGLAPDAARMRYGRAVTALLKVRRKRKQEMGFTAGEGE